VSPNTFLELNKAPTVNFSGVTSSHRFGELDSSYSKSFSKVGWLFLLGGEQGSNITFLTMFVNSEQSYYTNLLQKPGTNIGLFEIVRVLCEGIA